MPLQQCASVGQVYASAFQDDEAARQELAEAAGAPLAEPRLVHVHQRPAPQFWEKNVVALGGAAGFLEPLVGRRPASAGQRAVQPARSLSRPAVRPGQHRQLQRGDRRRTSSAFATSSSCTTARRAATTRRSGSSARGARCRTRCAQRIEHVPRHRPHRAARAPSCSPTSTGSGSSKARA